MAISLNQRLDELLAAEATRDLTAAEQDELDGLVAANPHIAADREAYAELLSLMRELPQASLPQHLERRVMTIAEPMPTKPLHQRLSTAVAVG